MTKEQSANIASWFLKFDFSAFLKINRPRKTKLTAGACLASNFELDIGIREFFRLKMYLT